MCACVRAVGEFEVVGELISHGREAKRTIHDSAGFVSGAGAGLLPSPLPLFPQLISPPIYIVCMHSMHYVSRM